MYSRVCGMHVCMCLGACTYALGIYIGFWEPELWPLWLHGKRYLPCPCTDCFSSYLLKLWPSTLTQALYGPKRAVKPIPCRRLELYSLVPEGQHQMFGGECWPCLQHGSWRERWCFLKFISAKHGIALTPVTCRKRGPALAMLSVTGLSGKGCC